MNRDPDPHDVPDEILKLLALHDGDLARMWDETHPDNPVGPREED
jgi:hypothetical protein